MKKKIATVKTPNISLNFFLYSVIVLSCQVVIVFIIFLGFNWIRSRIKKNRSKNNSIILDFSENKAYRNLTDYQKSNRLEFLVNNCKASYGNNIEIFLMLCTKHSLNPICLKLSQSIKKNNTRHTWTCDAIHCCCHDIFAWK